MRHYADDGGVRPEVRALIDPARDELFEELRALTQRPAALVLVAPDRDHADVVQSLGAGMRAAPGGVRVAAAPLDRVRAMAAEIAAPVAGYLAEPLAPGQVWCVVLSARGVAAVAITWPTTRAPRGRAS